MSEWSPDPMTQLVVDMRSLRNTVKDISEKLETHYVTQDQFAPVKQIVYGMVVVILLGFIGGLVSLIMRSGQQAPPAQVHIEDTAPRNEGFRR